MSPRARKTLKRLNVIAVIAIADALLLAVLLYASFTDSDLVHVLGPIHGGGFVILVALCARGASEKRWDWWFPAIVVVTAGPPRFPDRRLRSCAASSGPPRPRPRVSAVEEITWDLSHLLDARGARRSAAESDEAGRRRLLDRAETLAERVRRGPRGQGRRRSTAPGLREAMERLGRDLRAGRARRQLRPPALLGRHRGPGQRRPDADGQRARHGDPDQAALLRARVGRGPRRPRRGAARDRGPGVRRHHLRMERRYKPHLPEQARGDDLDRALGHRPRGLEPPLRRADLGAPRRPRRERTSRCRSTSRSRASSTPTANERRKTAEAVTAALEPGLRTRALRLQHAAPGQGDQGPAARATRTGSPRATSRTRPPTSRCRRWSRRSRAATTWPAAGTRPRRGCSGSSASPTTTAWPRSPPTTRRSRWEQGRELVTDSFASFSAEAGEVVERFFDEPLDRRAPDTGEARRRLLAPRPCPRSTPTSSSTTPTAAATSSPSPTSSATACTRRSPASRASSTRTRR